MNRQTIIDFGANPFVVSHTGNTGIFYTPGLNNLPTQKSVYFPIQSFACCNKQCEFDLSEPWFYKNGTFPGHFETKIGQGASSIVLRGTFQHKKAAFKFVEIENEPSPIVDVMDLFKTFKIGETQKFRQMKMKDTLKELNKQLNDMTSVQSVSGNKIVQFYGHFR